MVLTMKKQSTPFVAWLSADDLADKFRVSRNTIWRWSREGRLPAPIKLGEGTTRWRADEVCAALEKLRAAA